MTRLRPIHLPFAGALCLCLLLGFLLGHITAVHFSLPAAPVILREDTRPLQPAIHVQSITNGEYRGTMEGAVRLLIGNRQILPDKDGTFRAPSSLLRNEVIVQIPDGMTFVASKKGKKYYAVQSPQAASMAPQNRMYFKTAAEAEAKGYTK